jgi:hypothetical protein
MHARTRWLTIVLVAVVALAPGGALAKVKKKTVAKIWPSGAALALDAAGVPRLAFQSPDHRPFHAVRPDKKFVSEQVEDGRDAGWYAAIGVDSLGRAHMAYHAEQGFEQKLVYAFSDGGPWQTEDVDDGGYATSLALDADDQVHLLYTDGSGNLEYAQQEDVGWEFHALGFTANWFRTTSLALDADGNAHACYVRNTGFGVEAYYATNASGDWAETLLDGEGHLCSLALDGAGLPWVAVFAPDAVALHHHDGMAWSADTLVDFGLELPGFTIGPDGIALALDAADKPHLVATFFATSAGRGAEVQLFLAHDGEEWRAALLGTKDEGFDPVLAFGPDGVLHGIWRSGGEDQAKLSYLQATFPDLAGSWSGVALLPGGIAGTLTVANEGTDKSKSTPVALYRSADPVWDLGDLPIEAKLKVGSVKPGAARSVEIEVPTFAFASGDYLIAVIDPEKSLDDLDRSDNTVAAQIP